LEYFWHPASEPPPANGSYLVKAHHIHNDKLERLLLLYADNAWQGMWVVLEWMEIPE
jgi:hypothetical protein